MKKPLWNVWPAGGWGGGASNSFCSYFGTRQSGFGFISRLRVAPHVTARLCMSLKILLINSIKQ